METLDAQILSLTEQAATTALELVLRRAGLTPDPFAADHPHDQLRAALHHTDLLSPGDIPAQPPSDGDIVRVTLLYQDWSRRRPTAALSARGATGSRIAANEGTRQRSGY